MTAKNITPTESEIEAAFRGTNFGGEPNMHILKYSLLKVASGYHTGYTAQCIMHELKLVNKSTSKPSLTVRGKYYLWELFQGGYRL